MKDTRPMIIRYYELKIKVSEDLDNTKKSHNSLLKSAQNESTDTKSADFYKLWAELLYPQVVVLEESLDKLNKKIKEEGFDHEISRMLSDRNKAEMERKLKKQEELNHELQDLPD
jgi:outer membrane PBP1 activator LpoA protein